MPNHKKNDGEFGERLKILEKAVSSLADAMKKRDAETGEEIGDIFQELKALKVFLTRSSPEFKRQFPEIQRKVK